MERGAGAGAGRASAATMSMSAVSPPSLPTDAQNTSPITSMAAAPAYRARDGAGPETSNSAVRIGQIRSQATLCSHSGRRRKPCQACANTVGPAGPSGRGG